MGNKTGKHGRGQSTDSGQKADNSCVDQKLQKHMKSHSDSHLMHISSSIVSSSDDSQITEEILVVSDGPIPIISIEKKQEYIQQHQNAQQLQKFQQLQQCAAPSQIKHHQSMENINNRQKQKYCSHHYQHQQPQQHRQQYNQRAQPINEEMRDRMNSNHSHHSVGGIYVPPAPVNYLEQSFSGGEEHYRAIVPITKKSDSSIFNPKINDEVVSSPPISITNNNEHAMCDFPVKKGSIDQQYIQQQNIQQQAYHGSSQSHINYNPQPQQSQYRANSNRKGSNVAYGGQQQQNMRQNQRSTNYSPNVIANDTFRGHMNRRTVSPRNAPAYNNINYHQSKPLPGLPTQHSSGRVLPSQHNIPKASDSISNTIGIQAASPIQAKNKEAVVLDMTLKQINEMQGLRDELRGGGKNQSKTLREILAEKEARSKLKQQKRQERAVTPLPRNKNTQYNKQQWSQTLPYKPHPHYQQPQHSPQNSAYRHDNEFVSNPYPLQQHQSLHTPPLNSPSHHQHASNQLQDIPRFIRSTSHDSSERTRAISDVRRDIRYQHGFNDSSNRMFHTPQVSNHKPWNDEQMHYSPEPESNGYLLDPGSNRGGHQSQNNSAQWQPPAPQSNAYMQAQQPIKRLARVKPHNFNSRKENPFQQRGKTRQQSNKQSFVPPPPEVLPPSPDPGGYDSDESVFIHQWKVARRHSTGSSTGGFIQNKQLLGSPTTYANDKHGTTFHSNVRYGGGPQLRKSLQVIEQKSEAQLVEELELTVKQFYKKYWIEGKLGIGSFARVRKIKRKKDQKVFALKMIKKAGKSKEDLAALQREIAILAKIEHRNVVALSDWCETKKRIFMVLEFCDGGDVFERILKQKTFSEQEAVHVVKQVTEGLQHSHEKNIVHRDLKPDNLMYLNKSHNSPIIIIDFGLAGDCTNGPLTTPCGTAHYVAPEVLSSKDYGTKADMWSLGVIIYMLLCGFPPFFDASGNQKRLYKLIKLGKYRFPSPYWDYISENAKDLIRNLLQIDPKLRYNAQQTLCHKWTSGSNDEMPDLGALYMEQMKHFSSSRHIIDVMFSADGRKIHPKQQPIVNDGRGDGFGGGNDGRSNHNTYHNNRGGSGHAGYQPKFDYFARKEHAFAL